MDARVSGEEGEEAAQPVKKRLEVKGVGVSQGDCHPVRTVTRRSLIQRHVGRQVSSEIAFSPLLHGLVSDCAREERLAPKNWMNSHRGQWS